MQTLLKHWADALLEWLGLASAQDSGWDRWVAFTLVLLAVALFDFVCRTILVRGMRRIVKRTKATWDDDLFNPDVLSRLCNVVSAVVLGIVLPVVFEEQSEARTIVTRLVEVYIVVAVFRFINAVLFAVFQIASARPAWQNKPIKGLRQTGQGIAALICGALRAEGASRLPVYGVTLLMLFCVCWLVFGELRRSAVRLRIDGDTLAVTSFAGLGFTRRYDLKSFDAITSTILVSRGGAYEYRYLMKAGRRVVRVSAFYLKNYDGLCEALSEHCVYKGRRPMNLWLEMKEIFR